MEIILQPNSASEASSSLGRRPVLVCVRGRKMDKLIQTYARGGGGEELAAIYKYQTFTQSKVYALLFDNIIQCKLH